MTEILQVLKTMERYATDNYVPILNAASAELLIDIVKREQPRSILEIGTAIGYSTLLIADNMPIGSRIITIECDTERASVAAAFFQKTGKQSEIELIVGDASQVLIELSGKFDFVFIDAAKGQYLNYLNKILDKLSPNAIVIADNVLFRGMVNSTEPIPRRYRTMVKKLREYLLFITSDPRFGTTINDTGDGLAISRYQGEVL